MWDIDCTMMNWCRHCISALQDKAPVPDTQPPALQNRWTKNHVWFWRLELRRVLNEIDLHWISRDWHFPHCIVTLSAWLTFSWSKCRIEAGKQSPTSSHSPSLGPSYSRKTRGSFRWNGKLQQSDEGQSWSRLSHCWRRCGTFPEWHNLIVTLCRAKHGTLSSSHKYVMSIILRKSSGE